MVKLVLGARYEYIRVQHKSEMTFYETNNPFRSHFSLLARENKSKK